MYHIYILWDFHISGDFAKKLLHFFKYLNTYLFVASWEHFKALVKRANIMVLFSHIMDKRLPFFAFVWGVLPLQN